MRSLALAVIRLILPRSGRPGREQRGYIIMSLAIIGLVGGVSVAVPMLSRSIQGLGVQDAAGDNDFNGARSAAEHALWRLQYDPTVHDEMVGSPPTTVYPLPIPGSEEDATVSIAAASDPPDDNGLRVLVNVSPQQVPPNTPTEVTFTMRVVNDDVVAHDIIRLEAKPQAFSPTYVTGSSTGITTDDPSFTAGKWRWNLSPYGSVPPFGGEVQLSWRMIVDQNNEKNYWTAGSVRFDGIGTVSAPIAHIRVASLGDLVITSSVEPAQVTAGAGQTFEYTINVENTGDGPLTFGWIRHDAPTHFDYVDGSTSGETLADPSRQHDVINDRWQYRWNLGGQIIDPGATASISFEVTGNLVPGIYYSVSSALVQEDDSGSTQQPTVSTGEAAPITAVRWYEVVAEHMGKTVRVEAVLVSSGIGILLWDEY
ncbi:MAG: hypothetical protein WD208_09875 [Dehalococcoidia bacterium]